MPLITVVFPVPGPPVRMNNGERIAFDRLILRIAISDLQLLFNTQLFIDDFLGIIDFFLRANKRSIDEAVPHSL